MAKSKKETLRFNSWTRGGRGADIFEKGTDALEMERVNPLRGVDEWRLGQIFDDARDGIYADLAWLYTQIEGVEPALVTCCDMRESAAAECGWLVNTADAERTRGFDQTLADEQRDTLLAEFGASEDDIRELAGHLVGAFFRGAAHALPLWNEDGSLAGFKMLDLWNFAYDRETGIWYWNADASRDEGTFQPIPPGELVTVASTRHVDHAALPIFIRAALGAKRYGVWLDRFGIPPVGVIMPASAERGEQAAYMELARKFARGGSGILPNGSSVVYGTEARAVCPFIDVIRFQQQQIYTVGIGRVQSGETDAANLGGNAAGVVEDGFRRIVRRDARRIARAINDTVTRKVLGRLFPGRPALAQFAWDMEAKRTAHEVLEDASLAKNAGLAIDINQLSEMTGYTLEKAPETPAPGLFGGLNSDRSPKPSLQTAPESFKTPSKKPDGQGEGESVPELLGPFLSALKGDCKMISEEVEDLLNDLTPEKARALLDKLPDLVPEDPTLAPLLAEEMAKAFGDAFTASQKSHPSQESQEVVAKNAGTSEGARKGWETRRRNGWSMEQLKENKINAARLIETVLSDTGNGDAPPVELGAISESVAAEIRNVCPEAGDVTGAQEIIEPDFVRHVRNFHFEGRETSAGHLPMTKADLKKIPDVIADYDTIVKGSPEEGTNRPTIRYRKEFKDGTIVVCEVVVTNAYQEKSLHCKTAWKEMK